MIPWEKFLKNSPLNDRSGEFWGNKWTTFRHEINKPNVSQYYSSISAQNLKLQGPRSLVAHSVIHPYFLTSHLSAYYRS